MDRGGSTGGSFALGSKGFVKGDGGLLGEETEEGESDNCCWLSSLSDSRSVMLAPVASSTPSSFTSLSSVSSSIVFEIIESCSG